MKKFIACLLAFSLLLSISVSAAGTDIYTLDEDVSLMSLSAADSGIMPLDLTPDEAADLSFIQEDVEWLKSYFESNDSLSDIVSSLESLYSVISWIEDPLLSDGDGTYYVEEIMNNTGSLAGSLVTANGTLSDIYAALVNSREVPYLESIEEDLVEIWDFLDSESTYSSLIDVLSEANEPVVNGLSSVVSEIKTLDTDLSKLLQNSKDLTYLNASGAVMAMPAQNSLTTILRNGFAGLGVILKTPADSVYLTTSGFTATSSGQVNIGNLLRNGLVGLQVQMKASQGSDFLNSSGQPATTPAEVTLSYILRYGLLGLRSTIAGSETDNIYQGSITSNENVSTSFSATGLGPMLNKWLGAVQLDTGRLSYMFASPADLQAKKDSESTTQAVTDSFLDPDSDASIKLGDVGTLKDASAQVQQLGQTGVTPGQAFEQLGNADLFAFFTEETANDLDSRVTTYSRDPADQIVTNYYEQSRAEFFELIGKGD